MMVLLLVHATGRAQQPARPKLDLKWIFIRGRLAWEPPPRDRELPQYKRASADLMVFYPTGEFAIAHFSIGRYKHRAIFIVPGEGFSVRKGQWMREGRWVTVVGHFVNSDGVYILPSARNAIFQETLTTSGISAGRLCARLTSPSNIYVPLHEFENLSTFESILNEK